MARKRIFQTALAFVMLGVGVVLPQAQAQAIGEVYGPYYLLDMNSRKCLADPNSNTSDNTKMIIWNCLGTKDQKWYNEPPVTNNDYWTFNAASNKCLTVQNASTSDNAAVIQYTCNHGTNERWAYVKYSLGGGIIPVTVAGHHYAIDAYYQIVNVKSGRCLTVKNGDIADGAALLQFDCNSPGSNTWAQLVAY
jgi:hypothetical protein